MKNHNKKHLVSVLLSALLVFTSVFGAGFVYAEPIEGQSEITAENPTEATQEPTAEPTDEPAETADVEETQEPVTEEPAETAEAEESQEPAQTEEPVETAEATEEPTEAPAEEATETPTEAPAPTDETPEETAEPIESEEELLADEEPEMELFADEVTDITADFTDPTLLAYVRGKLGLSASQPITTENILKLSYVEIFGGTSVTSVAGLQHATNLTSIQFDKHNITDLGPLQNLNKIKNFRLSNVSSTPQGLAFLTNSAATLPNTPSPTPMALMMKKCLLIRCTR